jgi:glycosyltransferase involved in cell wall biosynthesis
MMRKGARGRSGVLLVHPGTQHSFRLARELASRGLLHGFWTGLAFDRDGLLCRTLSAGPLRGLRDTLANRMLAGIPHRSLHTRPWIELAAQAALRVGRDPQRTLHARNRRFQEAIPDAAFHEAAAVLGFDTSSWILVRRAERAGIPLLLDRSAPPPPARLFEALASKFPAWHDDFEPRDPEVAAAEHSEHAAASRILVASTFTRRLLVESGVPEGKIAVIPYGVDSESFTPHGTSSRESAIRFLYAGAINARKGVPLLLDAWRRLDAGRARLTLVGQIRRDRVALLRGLAGVAAQGRVPHAQMPAIYAAHDVLVFPSYHDGFGLVVLEAMAAGLPVIASAASAGRDLITDGEDGFVVPAGDTEALADRMRYFIAHPSRAQEMGRAARETAQRYSWQRYGSAWAQTLEREGVA